MTRYAELAAKVDAFFARVADRHGDDMQCATGCSECCHVRLTVTGVEARAIAGELAGWDAARREVLAANARAQAAGVCAALDASGRCLIYAARPIVCRSHGAPIRTDGVIAACRLNFARRGPAAADADCVIDQTTLSALVLAVDRDAGGDGSRVELASLLL